MEYIVFDNNLKIEKVKLKDIITKIINIIDNESFIKNKINQNIKVSKTRDTKEKNITEDNFVYLLNFYLNDEKLTLDRKNKRIFNDFLIENNFKIDIFKKKVYFNSTPRSRSLKYQQSKKVIKKTNIKNTVEKNTAKIKLDINSKTEPIVETSKSYKNVLEDIKKVTEEIDNDDLELKLNDNEKEELLDELSPLFTNPFENKKLSIFLGIVFGIIIAIIALYGINV